MLINKTGCGFNSLETVANVDDVLGEMFLEEIQPTEEQLIVGTLINSAYNWQVLFVHDGINNQGLINNQ